MPRLAGVNVLAILLAAIAIYLTGFVWYVILFSDAWMVANGYTEEMFGKSSPLLMFGGGFAMPLVISIGLGWIMKKANISGAGAAAMFGFVLTLLIVVPQWGYDYVYAPVQSVPAFAIDAGHSLISITLGAIMHAFFD